VLDGLLLLSFSSLSHTAALLPSNILTTNHLTLNTSYQSLHHGSHVLSSPEQSAHCQYEDTANQPTIKVTGILTSSLASCHLAARVFRLFFYRIFPPFRRILFCSLALIVCVVRLFVSGLRLRLQT
jgi:hypothetical protein